MRWLFDVIITSPDAEGLPHVGAMAVGQQKSRRGLHFV